MKKKLKDDTCNAGYWNCNGSCISIADNCGDNCAPGYTYCGGFCLNSSEGSCCNNVWIATGS